MGRCSPKTLSQCKHVSFPWGLTFRCLQRGNLTWHKISLKSKLKSNRKSKVKFNIKSMVKFNRKSKFKFNIKSKVRFNIKSKVKFNRKSRIKFKFKFEVKFKLKFKVENLITWNFCHEKMRFAVIRALTSRGASAFWAISLSSCSASFFWADSPSIKRRAHFLAHLWNRKS